MMRKILLPVVFVTFVLASGCRWTGVRGNGKITTEQRPVGEFTRIDTGGFYEIEWQPGAPSLRLTTDENLFSHIETRMENNVLKIRTHDAISPSDGIKIVATSASLTGAKLSGAGTLTADKLSGDAFALETSGASKVTLGGKVSRLLADLTGASKLNAAALQADTVEVSVTGAGKAEVNVTGTLKAAISGAGKVTYRGNPKAVEKKVSGVGKIEPAE